MAVFTESELKAATISCTCGHSRSHHQEYVTLRDHRRVWGACLIDRLSFRECGCLAYRPCPGISIIS